MRKDIRKILEFLSEITEKSVESVPTKARYSKIRVEIFGTLHDFAVPSKDFRAGYETNNFYTQMRRKINQRIETVRARQTLPV